jgi:hypothetical protein
MAWVLLALLVVGIFVAFNLYLQYQRQQMWRQLADRYSLRYRSEDPFDLPSRYRFALFDQGHAKKACNCLDGTYEKVPVILFDYEYTTGSGKNRTTHYVSALLAELEIDCPYLIIRPESVLDRFAAFFGFDDINFEYDEFNRAFNVKGDDKKFAYDICHAEMMELLLQNRTMTWEMRGQHVLLYSWAMGNFDPQKVAVCLRLMTGFVARIPGYLRNEARS